MAYADRAVEYKRELKKLRALYYKAQQEIGVLTVSLSSVLREFEALKNNAENKTHDLPYMEKK